MNKENLDENSKRVPPYLDPELSQETDSPMSSSRELRKLKIEITKEFGELKEPSIKNIMEEKILIFKKSDIKVIKIGLSILFLVCLLDMPFGYFQLVRFLGMIGFAILAYNNYQKNQPWFVVWASSAILINPFLKIALGREIWNIVDLIWVVLLIVSIFINKKYVE
jgi:hypothetical protein